MSVCLCAFVFNNNNFKRRDNEFERVRDIRHLIVGVEDWKGRDINDVILERTCKILINYSGNRIMVVFAQPL